MDQITLNTIQNVLIGTTFVGLIGSVGTIQACQDRYRPIKTLVSSLALFAGSFGMLYAINKNIDPIKLEQERIEKRELNVQEEMKQIQIDKQKLELERKKSELDKQINAITVIDTHKNPYVTFALRGPNARV